MEHRHWKNNYSWDELSLHENPFTDSDVEDAAEDFVLIDESDDEDDFIDI